MQYNRIVSQDAWLVARKRCLIKVKEGTRLPAQRSLVLMTRGGARAQR